MEWAYVQIASLVAIVLFACYIAVADYRINKEKNVDQS